MSARTAKVLLGGRAKYRRERVGQRGAAAPAPVQITLMEDGQYVLTEALRDAGGGTGRPSEVVAAARMVGPVEVDLLERTGLTFDGVRPRRRVGPRGDSGHHLTYARFSGFEPRPVHTDVSEADHREYRHAVETMDGVLQSARGGIVQSEGARRSWARPSTARSECRRSSTFGFRRVMIGTHTVGVDLEERNTDRIAREVLPLVDR